MPECPDCGHTDLDTEDNNAALRDDPDHDHFCVVCGGLFTEEEIER